MRDVTRILLAMENGESHSKDELLPAVYEELRRMAAGKMAAEAPGNTLQATALVHEAWLSLVDSPNQTWKNRAHFFGAASEAMRRILIDRARRRKALRRGGGAEHVQVEGVDIAVPVPDDTLLALHEALDKLALVEPEQAQLVKLRFFVGMTLEEASGIMGISEATAKRWWSYSKAWLFHEVHEMTGAAPWEG